jgi:hypothetical protein
MPLQVLLHALEPIDVLLKIGSLPGGLARLLISIVII